MGGLSLWVRRRVAAAVDRRCWRSPSLVAVAGGVATALAPEAHRADTALARFREATGPFNLVAETSLGGEKPTSPDELDRASGRASCAPLPNWRMCTGVESVSVESWWGIRILPDFDAPNTVSAFAIGTFGCTASDTHPLSSRVRCRRSMTPTPSSSTKRRCGCSAGRSGRATPSRRCPRDRLFEWFNNDAEFTSTDALDGPRDRGRGRRRRASRRRPRRQRLSGDASSRKASPAPTPTRSPTSSRSS